MKNVNSEPSADRGWRWLWAGAALLALALLVPAAWDLYQLRSARKAGDLPKAMIAARALSESFFGPLFSSWLDGVTKEIQAEVVEGNLLSIKRLVPDSEESAYAEMELGRLALGMNNPRQAAMHFERYLKSGLGRDLPRARMDLSEAYRELKQYDESAKLLQQVLNSPDAGKEAHLEAAYRLGDLYQFYLNRAQDAVKIYQRAIEDTVTPGRWRNDILTNLSLLKE